MPRHAQAVRGRPGPRLRVFISSVIDGFGEYRLAAAEGVEAAGAEPVMVERFPSLATSPRNACLDGVQASDAYLALVGQRGGWTTPSGALAVEEEFEEAKRRGLPVLVLLQKGARDEQADRLARRLSDYVSGAFRKTFSGPTDVRAQVAAAVARLMSNAMIPESDPKRVQTLLQEGEHAGDDASARLVLLPERRDEILSPERMESRALVQEIYSVAHAAGFFDYECGKTHELTTDGVLVFSQNSRGSRPGRSASLRLSAQGEAVIEADISARDIDRDPTRYLFVLLESDLAAALSTEFALAYQLFERLDPHQRFASIWLGAAVVGAGSRYLVPARPEGSSVSVRMWGDKGPTIADATPRKVGRTTLRDSAGEVSRLMALFRRQLGEGSR